MRKNIPVPINNCKKKIKYATQLPRNLAHNRKKVTNESKTTIILKLDTTKNLSLLELFAESLEMDSLLLTRKCGRCVHFAGRNETNNWNERLFTCGRIRRAY